MKITERAIIAVITICLLLLVSSCVRWKWGECRKVGHGVAYCAMDMGR